MSKKILIVDDVEEFCQVLSEILRDEEGYQVETVCDGLQASLMIERSGYDIILLDLKLPNLSGFELLKIIREKKFKTKVLILTGSPLLNSGEGWGELPAQIEEREKILKLADGIVDKISDVEFLLNKIKEMLL